MVRREQERRCLIPLCGNGSTRVSSQPHLRAFVFVYSAQEKQKLALKYVRI